VNGRQQKVAGCAGILFVVLFAAGIVLSGSSPALNASTAKITQYYQNHHAGILVSELLINLASVVLLWFLGGLYAILRQRDEHGFLAPVVLASGAATVTLGMVSDLAGTVAGLLAAQPGSPARRQRPRTSSQAPTGPTRRARYPEPAHHGWCCGVVSSMRCRSGRAGR